MIGLPFSQRIVDWLATPVTKLNYSLVFTAPAEAFWVQVKVGIIVGVFLAAPAILWQVWAFIAPGLHAHEKKYAAPFVIIGSLLFLGGGAFSLFVVTPYAIQFLLSYARPGLTPMITIQNSNRASTRTVPIAMSSNQIAMNTTISHPMIDLRTDLPVPALIAAQSITRCS